VAKLAGAHAKGVACLAFSADGSTLATVGSNSEHEIALWNWQSSAAPRPLSVTKGGSAKILAVSWSPNVIGTELSPNEAGHNVFVAVGVKLVKVMTMTMTMTLLLLLLLLLLILLLLLLLLLLLALTQLRG